MNRFEAFIIRHQKFTVTTLANLHNQFGLTYLALILACYFGTRVRFTG